MSNSRIFDKNRSVVNYLLLLSFISLCLACGVQKQDIHFAASQGDLGKVKTLLAQGVDVNAKDSNGDTPLRCALLSGQYDLAKYLISQGGTIDYVNTRGGSPRDYIAKNTELSRWVEENIGPDPRDKKK